MAAKCLAGGKVALAILAAELMGCLFVMLALLEARKRSITGIVAADDWLTMAA